MLRDEKLIRERMKKDKTNEHQVKESPQKELFETSDCAEIGYYTFTSMKDTTPWYHRLRNTFIKISSRWKHDK